MTEMHKNGNRVLFLVDHKHRDLPGLALIGYFLRQMGHQVKYVALWQERELLKSFDPKYIVLPKPLYECNRLVRFKLSGRKTVVINTEGNPQDKRFKMNIEVPPDLYFFWNKSQLELDKSSLVNADTIPNLTGCPRMDFHHKNMANLFPTREVLLTRYGLSSDNKTITIATSTQDADFDDASLEYMNAIRNRILSETADYRDLVKNQRKSRLFLKEMIQHIVNVYPNVNIVVKPHPNENITYWRRLVDSHSSANIYLCIGEPLNHLLQISDLHIAHNICTTTAEAMIAGIPTIEIQTELSHKLYGKDHLKLPDYIITNTCDLDCIINTELYTRKGKNKPKVDDNKRLKSYIEKYLYKVDGCRCYEHAKKIDIFIKRTTNNSTFSMLKSMLKYFGSHKNQLAYFVINELMRPLYRLKGVAKSLVITASPLEDNKTIVAQKGDSKVDSRGRYDNRINLGDEECWFAKFEQADFRVEDFEEYLGDKSGHL